MFNRKIENNVFWRLLTGTAANSVGKLWQLAIQLATIPILTYFWGVEGLGVWLMISTIPNYLAYSELGVGAAGVVEMTRLETLEKKAEARIVFNTTWIFLTGMTALVGVLIACGTAVWFLLAQDDDGAVFTASEIAIAVFLTVLATLLSIQMNIRRLVFQATHKFAIGVLTQDFLFMLTLAAMLVAVSLGAGLVAAASVQLLTRIVALLLYIRLQRRYEPEYTVSFKAFDKSTLRRLLKPSMGAFALTLANSFGLQGVVLTIGWTLGPAAAAVFASTRMLTRIPMQFSGLVTRASLPELTRAQVDENTVLTHRLMRLNVGLTLSVMAPALVILILFGPQLLSLISHNEMDQTHLAFALLGLAATFCAIWTTLGTRLIAVNRQSEFAYLALVLYLACALIPILSKETIIATLIALALADGVIAVKTWKAK
ncbi:oligosaccharide flippase family protein [Celeribacter sp. PS-C1]|uniref:oligosaccharide flippase family protein n=1 Tax=Celeribacter sp. PS-C1 TaxID=2820813 RepID=UPI001CA4D6D5|nr:oligosaccharide flippase family protein [Celeribacter sp. PS-C1]MBW6417904.1 oligosaccharide flippase family protein [Celeribacter sp. PS-C1]